VLFRLAQLSEESGIPRDAPRYLREAVSKSLTTPMRGGV